MADKILDSTGLAHLVTKIKEGISEKSKVSVSETGTSTTAVKYITVDGTEYKLPTGGSLPHILTGIGVITLPKTEYTAGEKVDVTGIVVNALYADDDNVDITSECTYSPTVDTVIYEDTTAIIVSWVNEGITYTTNIPITVTRVLSEITVTQVPNKVEYKVNEEALDLTGMIITAIYNSGKSEVVTNYTTDPVEGTIFTESANITLTITYTENEITKTATTDIIASDALALVDWSTGTDEEIANMVAAADAGVITLSDYWEVGQTRSVSLSAMSATGVGESHAAQTVELVLMDTTCTGFTITNTSKKPSFIVGMKNCLNEIGYMNSSSQNTNGWSGCARRTWCNSVFYNAIPSTLRPIFKQFTWKQGSGGGASSGLLSTDDYFALPPEKAIFGSRTYSFSDEADLYSNWEWYQTSTNRKKTVNNSAGSWRECSPYSGYSSNFCSVRSGGAAGGGSAGNANGLAPFGCI